ncbi:MAG: DUF805 domain-containing protein [Burkholderiales bacterium]
MTEPALNPYAAPQARVDDVHAFEGVGELKLFSAQGRIGRLRLLAYNVGATLVFYAVIGVVSLLAATLGGAAGLLMIPPFAAFIWFSVVSCIKRCHDADCSGWWALTFFIPFVGLIWLIKAGTPSANRFGAPPPANTLGVKVLGWMLPVFFVVGILAAVSIPAYKDYTDRARAAQNVGR